MKVVEDCKSRPHIAVSSVVERDQETQEWNEQQMPKVLPGYSGGMLPGRSTKEAGRGTGGKRQELRKKNQSSNRSKSD